MLKSLTKLSSLILLSNLLAVKAQEQSVWQNDDNVLSFMGKEIKGFRISHFGDRYEANTDYTGVLFYDMGQCTRKVAGACGQMKDGYVIIHKDEELIKLRNEMKLKSLGEAALKKFFKNKTIKYLIKMVTDYDVKMAMFNIKGGVLNTQLSTQVYRIAVDNSPNMNAFEYALLDSIRDLWVKKGKRSTHWVSAVQKNMRSRSGKILEAVAGLRNAEEFRQEYTPDSTMPAPKQVVKKQTNPTTDIHHGRHNTLPENVDWKKVTSVRQVGKGDSTGHMITLGLPRVIGAGGGSFIQGDLLNTETSENLYKPKASDLGIRKTIVSGYAYDDGSGEYPKGLEKLIINMDELHIQEIPSTPENWAYFGCDLYKDGDKVTFNSPTPLYMSETEIGDTFAEDFLTKAHLGGGAQLERHDNEHYHAPMNKKSGGYYLVGKTYMERDGPEQFQIEVAAMKIPYGYGLVTRPYVWHGDGFLSGKWRFAYNGTPNTLTFKLYKDNENETIPVYINTLAELEAAKDDEKDQESDDIYDEGDDSEDIYDEGGDSDDYDENDIYDEYEENDDSAYDEN